MIAPAEPSEIEREPVIRHFMDIEFTVIAIAHRYAVRFRVFAIVTTEHPSGKPLWRKAGLDECKPTDNLDEAERYLHGIVEWDGSSDWYFDEQERAMLNGGTRSDLVNIGEVMARCWDWAKELIPTFDGLA